VVQVRSRAHAPAVAALETALADAGLAAGHALAAVGDIGRFRVRAVDREGVGSKSIGLEIFFGAAEPAGRDEEPEGRYEQGP
jgi:hypothetical protein